MAGPRKAKPQVHRPLREQLLEAVEGGTFVPVRSLSSLLRGGTAADKKKAVTELLAEGRVTRVIRGDAETLVPAPAPVYSREELAARKQALDALGKALGKALKHGDATLLRADVAESLAEAFPEVARPAARGPRATPAAPAFGVQKLLDALDATRDATLGLSFIPRVVAHLRGDLGVEAARASLLDAAERGLVELRPEGGLHRLSREELELCLPGPQGTRLSWARKIEGRTP